MAEEQNQTPEEEQQPEEQPAAEAEAPTEKAPAEEQAAEPEAPAAEAEAETDQTPEGEPVAEAAAEEEAAAGEVVEEPAPAAAPERRKRKHVPRPQRRQRPKPKRERAGERKPIVRLPKPEHERGRTQERRGVVVSSAMDKTIVVKVDTLKVHPRYKKVIKRSSKFHAHDEQNQAKVGDVVRIVETRPLSKTKSWRLAEVVEAAK
jgi:small subunit ribosomal protein S17